MLVCSSSDIALMAVHVHDLLSLTIKHAVSFSCSQVSASPVSPSTNGMATEEEVLTPNDKTDGKAMICLPLCTEDFGTALTTSA